MEKIEIRKEYVELSIYNPICKKQKSLNLHLSIEFDKTTIIPTISKTRNMIESIKRETQWLIKLEEVNIGNIENLS